MGEKRLTEITSTINMLDGPMLVISYLMSLGESDMYLFLKYVKKSKYRKLNIYDAIKLFSSDYLNGKTLEQDNIFAEEIDYHGEMQDIPGYSDIFSTDYSVEWNSSNEEVAVKSASKR